MGVGTMQRATSDGNDTSSAAIAAALRDIDVRYLEAARTLELDTPADRLVYLLTVTAVARIARGVLAAADGDVALERLARFVDHGRCLDA